MLLLLLKTANEAEEPTNSIHKSTYRMLWDVLVDNPKYEFIYALNPIKVSNVLNITQYKHIKFTCQINYFTSMAERELGNSILGLIFWDVRQPNSHIF